MSPPAFSDRDATSHFARLHGAGKLAVLSNALLSDAPPLDGGRWGLALLLRPPGDLARKLGTLAEEAAALAGPGHWPTGAAGAGHVTVRALERFRRPTRRDPDREAQLARLMAQGAAGAAPVHLVFRGLSLSPATVFAMAISPDASADVLRREMARVFTDDLEATDFVRDPIWYLTLAHFSGPVAHPGRLLSWVEWRRHLEIGHAVFAQVELCRFDFDGRLMRPSALATAPLGPAPR